jgi:excisionase family DNA binding protein
MIENTMSPWAELEFLRVRQVASLLNISRLGVYRLIERGLIPVYRVARCALLKRSDIVALLANCRVPARHESTYGGQKD